MALHCSMSHVFVGLLSGSLFLTTSTFAQAPASHAWTQSGDSGNYEQSSHPARGTPAPAGSFASKPLDLPPPRFYPAPGTYNSTQSVAILGMTGGTMYCAINATPTTASPECPAAITVASSETIEAIQVLPGFPDSAPAVGTYTIVTPSAVAGEWAWMGGSTTPNQPGIYGSLGDPAPANIPGGRSMAASSIDQNGNVWLFGGVEYLWAYNNALLCGQCNNDLWKFSPATNEWTWMSGSNNAQEGVLLPGVYGTLGTPDPANVPGSRYSALTWIDLQGNLWLFGGQGVGSVPNGLGILNDLWQFNPSTGEWTWMAGSNVVGQWGIYGTLRSPAPANTPGARYSAVGWTDPGGNLWLFGGDPGPVLGGATTLNDLWKFDTSARQWTWMGGSSQPFDCCHPIPIFGVSGVYGEMGIPAATNSPGSREGAVSWVDSGGNLWLFGGWGFNAGAFDFGPGLMNDLWEFSPSAAEWTWMGGSSTAFGLPNVSGTQGIPSASNFPGSRSGASGAVDNSGKFWLFAGEDANTGHNDLWTFDPSSEQWTWMGGGQAGTPVAVYGIPQVPAANTTPNWREGASAWIDRNGDFWFFGGTSGYGLSFNNDLWKFQPFSSVLPVAAAPAFTPDSGTYTSAQSVSLTDSTPGASILYLIGGNTSASTYAGPIQVGSTATLQAVASAHDYANSGIASAAYTLNLPQSFTFSVAPGTLTIRSGAQGTATLTVTPVNGFNAPVGFSCSGLPTGASCSFGPATITPSGAAVSSQLTITTIIRAASTPLCPSPLLTASALATVLWIFPRKKRRSLLFAFLVPAITMLTLISGCSGEGSHSSGNTTVSTVTVTATASVAGAPMQQVASVSLTVN